MEEVKKARRESERNQIQLYMSHEAHILLTPF